MKMLDFYRITAAMWATAAVVAALLLFSPAIYADENEEVLKLYKQGNLAKALEQADVYLASKPRTHKCVLTKG